MRNLLKMKVSEQVLQFFQQWEQSKNVEWHCPDSFTINYIYPCQVSGIYVSMYNQHANYPIEQVEKLIAALVGEIVANASSYEHFVYLCN